MMVSVPHPTMPAASHEVEPPKFSGAAVVLEKVRKSFGSVVAVDDVSLDIGRGTIFSLLGPSGCGKTTTLRLIAGFADPDAGSIKVG